MLQKQEANSPTHEPLSVTPHPVFTTSETTTRPSQPGQQHDSRHAVPITFIMKLVFAGNSFPPTDVGCRRPVLPSDLGDDRSAYHG
jgi:hypothetical protein